MFNKIFNSNETAANHAHQNLSDDLQNLTGLVDSHNLLYKRYIPYAYFLLIICSLHQANKK